MTRAVWWISLDLVLGLTVVIAVDSQWSARVILLLAWLGVSAVAGWVVGRHQALAFPALLIPLALLSIAIPFGHVAGSHQTATAERMVFPALYAMVIAWCAATARRTVSRPPSDAPAA
jgi:hypothetical protein